MSSIDRIYDYAIWGRIAEGGMGDVWLGRHLGLNMPVVIKTLKLESLGDAEHASRLLAEARMEARISNAHVVRVVDTGMHDGAPFLVKEYVDGLDLRAVAHSRQIAMRRTMPLWFVCEVGRQIAEALEASHRVGIIHRDVKPSNVIGQNFEFKLTDFGLAVRSVDTPRERSGGTLHFMAPEALRGEAVDDRVDVFALGATLFALRYGFSPFATVSATLDEAPVHFSRCTDAAEAAFQYVVGRMLAKRVDDRPSDLADARQLLGSLAAMLRPALGAARTGEVYTLGDTILTLHEGDIAAHRADAIVNSANYEMTMRDGVGAAIVRRGGEPIEREAATHGQQPLGTCIATSAGGLDAKHVLHAVCAWQSTSCVGRATQSTLLTAASLGARSIAFPALGTGAGKVPFEASALSIAAAVKSQILLGGSPLRRITFVLADAAKLRTFRQVLESVLFEDRTVPNDVGLPASPVSPDAHTLRAVGSSMTPDFAA